MLKNMRDAAEFKAELRPGTVCFLPLSEAVVKTSDFWNFSDEFLKKLSPRNFLAFTVISNGGWFPACMSFTSPTGPRRQGGEHDHAQYPTNDDVTSGWSCRRPENVSILSSLLASNDDGDGNEWRQKRHRFITQNNKFARASRFFSTCLYRPCTTTTWKCLIASFMEDVNKRRQISFPLSKPDCGPQEINSREIRLHLPFSANWNKRDKDWKKGDAKAPWSSVAGRGQVVLVKMLSCYCILLLALSPVSAQPSFDLIIYESAKLSDSMLDGVGLMTYI